MIKRTALKFVVAVLLLTALAGCWCQDGTKENRGDFKGADMDRTIRFGLIADIQYADKDTAGQRYYRAAMQKLTDCVDQLNERELDFVIQVGDLIDGGKKAVADFDDILAVYNELNARKYHVLGNHDFAGISRKAVLDKMEIDRGYYDFTVSNWRFVVLDTMDLAVSGGWPEDSDQYRQSTEMLKKLQQAGAPNAVDWNGGISNEQMVWLDHVLADADSNDQNAIVFGHHPLQPAGDPHIAWNAGQIVKIIESHDCVAAYMNGHNHAGKYTYHNGIAYITFIAMVDMPTENAFAVIEISNDAIQIEGFGRIESRAITGL